jgi:tRNA threonylcarbamoyladenosine modification (KEOPS) complex Cgi121 subunit
MCASGREHIPSGLCCATRSHEAYVTETLIRQLFAVQFQASAFVVLLNHFSDVYLLFPEGDTGALVCRNMPSEIVYNLSATRNIGKALVQFGISDESTSVLFVLLRPTKTTVDSVRAAVDGNEVLDIEAGLRNITNLAAVRTVYEISLAESKTSDIVDSIVTRMAARDIR